MKRLNFRMMKNEKPFTPFLSLFLRDRRLRLSGIQEREDDDCQFNQPFYDAPEAPLK